MRSHSISSARASRRLLVLSVVAMVTAVLVPGRADAQADPLKVLILGDSYSAVSKPQTHGLCGTRGGSVTTTGVKLDRCVVPTLIVVCAVPRLVFGGVRAECVRSSPRWTATVAADVRRRRCATLVQYAPKGRRWEE